jgi:hypothetical protein
MIASGLSLERGALNATLIELGEVTVGPQTLKIGKVTTDSTSAGDVVAHVTTIFFTGPVLAIVAIVACGKWLGMLFVLPQSRDDTFGPSIPGFISFKATGQEALLGLTGFALTLVVIGVTVRGQIGPFVEKDFGLNIGQFVSLCFASSLAILTLAVLTFAVKVIVSLPLFHRNSLVTEQERRIKNLTR